MGEKWLYNTGINKLANTRSDVSIQKGKTRFGINKEHTSDLRFLKFYKIISLKFPFIKLVYPYVITLLINIHVLLN
jgi:hypothetical protein